MSFPRANIKRFNENNGCAPPPGTYDPKLKDKAAGGVVDKTERFKAPKVDQRTFADPENVSTVSASTPAKKALNLGGSSTRKASTSADSSQIKDLEKEIRRLLTERSDKERQLSLKEDSLRKLEGRLHNTQLEKTALQARIVSAEKELNEAKKATELLKTKVSGSENWAKKHEEVQAEVASLLGQVRDKEAEILRLQGELTVALATLVDEVTWFEASLETLEKALLPKDSEGRCVELRVDGTVSPILQNKTDIMEFKDEKLSTENRLSLIKTHYQGLHERTGAIISHLEAKSGSLKVQYTILISENMRLQDALGDVQARLQDAVSEKCALERHRDEVFEAKCTMEVQVHQLAEKNTAANENLKKLTVNIEELQMSKSTLQEQFTELKLVHETACKDSAAKIKYLEDRETIVCETTSSLHERIVELQAENEDLAATLKETSELLCKTKEENCQLKNMLKVAESEWQAEKKQFLIQVEELVFEKSKMEGELTESENKVKLLECDIVDQKAFTEEQIEALNNQLKEEQEEFVQLKNKLGDLVYEKSQLHMEIGHLEAQMKIMKSECEETKSEADKAVVSLHDRVVTLEKESETFQTKVSVLQNENETLQSTLEKFQVDFDEYSTKSMTERDEAQSKIVELSEQVGALTEQREKLSKDLDEWQLEKTELDMEIATLQGRVKVLEMEKTELQEDYETRLGERDRELVRVQGDYETLLGDRDRELVRVQGDYETRLGERDRELVRVQGDYETRLGDRDRELVRVQGDYETRLGERDRELVRVQEERLQLERNMEQYGIDLLSNAGHLRTVQEQLQGKLTELQTLEEDHKQLKANIAEKEECLSRVQSELTALQQSCESNTFKLEKSGADNKQLQERLNEKETSLSSVQAELIDLQKSYDMKCVEVQDQLGEVERLSDQLQTQGEKYEDLDCRYQQTRADFIRRCDERDELFRKNEAKDASLQLMSRQLLDIQAEVKEAQAALEEKTKENDSLKSQMMDKEVELVSANQKVSNYKQQIEDYKEHLQSKSDECDDLQMKCEEMDVELSMAAREAVDLHERVDALRKETEQGEVEKTEIVSRYEKELSELREQVMCISSTRQLEEDLDKYRRLYEELQAKVEPFMEQLDAFQLEKNMLLGQTRDTQAEMAKLGRDYALLLGNQNQKQKIKHVAKLKEEYGEMKKENFALRDQVEKLKRQVRKMEDKVAPRRFDLSKPFAGSKENLSNTSVAKSPLKEVNRK
ncbi:hyaluronan mediated motility receptor-like isoform X2 [Dreissena polymorpha]|uniref:Hyaluronan-mediated motility receptor C-terminal domain-containing protein n=1 Tax=Dreissena polymorpha TaxID=45954 RepID=A0A9D4KG87_DREPO|nr:hyaluronan mediated motility receptor-like isoform X2 [Dreissena polymorpha]KAH3838894.1 hypothetical protein DPMN_112311 [Dreissena polymorpha]